MGMCVLIFNIIIVIDVLLLEMVLSSFKTVLFPLNMPSCSISTLNNWYFGVGIFYSNILFVFQTYSNIDNIFDLYSAHFSSTFMCLDLNV